jgi:RNA 2',3'-cyclic 3'-phosphodiesterase
MDIGSDPYARVWQSFRRSSMTADGRHDTQHWRSHAGPFALCLIRVPAIAVEPELDALRDSVSTLSGVRLHPDHFLHVTLQELGFVVDVPVDADEISAARLEEFAVAAADAVSGAPPFTVALRGANSFLDAIFLEPAAAPRLTELHERLFALAAFPTASDFLYLPHCTIAHYDGTASTRAAEQRIAPWRERTFGVLDVSEIEIVTLDPRDAYPSLDSYAVIPLEG